MLAIASSADLDEQENANLVPLSIVQGTSKQLSFSVKENGEVLPLTGCIIRAVIWRKFSDVDPIAEWTVASRDDALGVFTIMLTKSASLLGAKVTEGYWSCTVTWPGGLRCEELAHGPVAFPRRAA